MKTVTARVTSRPCFLSCRADGDLDPGQRITPPPPVHGDPVAPPVHGDPVAPPVHRDPVAPPVHGDPEAHPVLGDPVAPPATETWEHQAREGVTMTVPAPTHTLSQ